MAGFVRYRPNPNFEYLLMAGDVDRWKLVIAAIGKMLDIAVIAIIQAAGFADDLVEMTTGIAVLAEPGIGDCQGIPVRIFPCDIDWKTKTNGSSISVLFDDGNF